MLVPQICFRVLCFGFVTFSGWSFVKMGLANREDKRREREQRREGSTYRSYGGGLKGRKENKEGCWSGDEVIEE